jgi:hypothetical protein
MKRILYISIVLVGCLAFGGSFLPTDSASAGPRRETAIVEFAQTVKLRDVLLRGQYLVVHDEERMARGEACTYVYRGTQINEQKLVVSFHCIHVDRDRADAFKVTFTRRVTPFDVPEIKEIQFAGSKDGHAVP